MANGYGQKDCPVARALDVIGERWSLLVPRNLFRKRPLRFQEFEQGLAGVVPNTLSARLKALESDGHSTSARSGLLITHGRHGEFPVEIALALRNPRKRWFRTSDSQRSSSASRGRAWKRQATPPRAKRDRLRIHAARHLRVQCPKAFRRCAAFPPDQGSRQSTLVKL